MKLKKLDFNIDTDFGKGGSLLRATVSRYHEEQSDSGFVIMTIYLNDKETDLQDCCSLLAKP